MAAVDRQLGAKGFQKADSNPEVYVTYHGEEKEQTTLDTTHMGYGYAGDWYWDGGRMDMEAPRLRLGTINSARVFFVGELGAGELGCCRFSTSNQRDAEDLMFPNG